MLIRKITLPGWFGERIRRLKLSGNTVLLIHRVSQAIPFMMTGITLRKRRPRDEGLQREIIPACFALSPVLQLVLAVDDDVDIYSPHDLLWAIITRWDAEKGIMKAPARSSAYSGAYPSSSGIGIDATVPWNDRDLFERAHYPSDLIDLRNWLTEEQIHSALARQGEYARLLAVTGH